MVKGEEAHERFEGGKKKRNPRSSRRTKKELSQKPKKELSQKPNEEFPLWLSGLRT